MIAVEIERQELEINWEEIPRGSEAHVRMGGI